MRGSSSDSRHPKNMEIAQLIKSLHRESQQQYRRWHPFWFALTECQKHTNAQAQFYKRAFALLSLASRSYFALLRWRLGPSVSNRKQSGQYCHGWNVTRFRHCSYTCQRLLCDVSESTLKRSWLAWAIKIIIALQLKLQLLSCGGSNSFHPTEIIKKRHSPQRDKHYFRVSCLVLSSPCAFLLYHAPSFLF